MQDKVMIPMHHYASQAKHNEYTCNCIINFFVQFTNTDKQTHFNKAFAFTCLYIHIHVPCKPDHYKYFVWFINSQGRNLYK